MCESSRKNNLQYFVNIEPPSGWQNIFKTLTFFGPIEACYFHVIPTACSGGGAASIISKGKKSNCVVRLACWQCTPLAWQSDIENMYVLYVVYTSIININNWIEDILNVVGNTSQKAGWSREMERLHHKLNYNCLLPAVSTFPAPFLAPSFEPCGVDSCDDFNAVWNLPVPIHWTGPCHSCRPDFQGNFWSDPWGIMFQDLAVTVDGSSASSVE